jgi:hypothetical protein
MGSKKISVALVVIGFIVMIASIVGVVMNEDAKEEYLFDNNSGTGEDISFSRIVDAGHNYTVDVEVHDEAYYEAVVNASVTIYIDGVSVIDTQLYNLESSGDEGGGNIHASDYAIYEFLAIDDVNVTVLGSVHKGDDWDVSIYQDLPSSFGELTVVLVILVLVGLVAFLAGMCILLTKRS